MQQREKRVPKEDVGRGLSKAKKKRKTYDSNPAKRHTVGVSYKEEADLDLKMGLEALKKYQDSGGLSFHLRKAGTLFKMAANRYDHAEHLKGNTLEEYVKEAKKK